MINDKFIFIHIPKTGGQFIRNLFFLKKNNWKFLLEPTHISLKESKKRLQNHLKCKDDDIRLQIPSFAFVRNPWDYCVSRYFFRQKLIKNNTEKQHIIIERLENNEKGFMDHMYMLAELSEKMENYTDSFNKFVLTEKGEVARGRSFNFLSISGWYESLVDEQISHIGRFENFSQDLIKILLKICPENFTQNELKNKTKKTINVSKHVYYKSYYNQELIDLVAKWDEQYIKKFKYDF